MLEKFISSFLAFLLSIGLATSNKPIEPVNNETTILFAGDVMLGRSVMGTSLDMGDSYYPFRRVSDFTKNADITVVNLENPIIENCPRHFSGTFTFCTTPEIAKGLEFAGIDLVSLANNHSGNYKEEGLKETKKYLEEMGIAWTDGTNLAIIEKNGIKFGFLGFDYVFKQVKTNDLILVKEADKKVDFLIVYPHWGEEYQPIANNFQVTTAQKFIENGADLIVGSHPHWVQNDEIVNGVPVYYSLGNFVFDQMWSEETKKGKLVKLSFENNKIVKTEEFNTYISKMGQPEIISP